MTALAYRFTEIPEGERSHRTARVENFRRREPDLARQIESRHCPTCGAKPGQLCRSENGRIAWYHVPRTG